MTVEQDVLAAGSPREALLVLARAIDDLSSSPDPWGEWYAAATVTPASHVAASRSDQPRTNYGALMVPDVLPEAADAELEVDVPPPSLSKMITRLRFEAQALHIGEYLNDDTEDWSAAYAKGGPVWLYTNNRELVMSLPESTRAAMIEDVIEDNPELAHEMSRDILKQAGETGPGSSAMKMA